MENLYLLPLTAGAVVFVLYLAGRYRLMLELAKKLSLKNAGLVSAILQRAACIIPPDSRLRRVYEKYVLKYSNISFERLFELKVYLFLIFMLLFFSIYYTNIEMFTGNLLSNFRYRVDIIFEYNGVENENEALKQEIKYFERARNEIGDSISKLSSAEGQSLIRNMITERRYELLQPAETIANKVYHRLSDYYGIRNLSIFPYVLMSYLLSFLPELVYIIRGRFLQASAKREMRFLKKLIILNGSIPPVDFMEVLRMLISKAVYYKKTLQDIYDGNIMNTLDNKRMYAKLVSETKSVSEKLFFEKLDEANNYNFEQAIKNIEYEFLLEKREIARSVRKQINRINMAGLLGFVLILVVVFIYLIYPWLNLYDANEIGL